VGTLLNPFTGPLLEDMVVWFLIIMSLVVLVHLGTCGGKSFVITQQSKVGYQVVKGIHAGVWFSTLSTKVHTTKKTNFYIGASCGFGLTITITITTQGL